MTNPPTHSPKKKPTLRERADKYAVENHHANVHAGPCERLMIGFIAGWKACQRASRRRKGVRG